MLAFAFRLDVDGGLDICLLFRCKYKGRCTGTGTTSQILKNFEFFVPDCAGQYQLRLSRLEGYSNHLLGGVEEGASKVLSFTTSSGWLKKSLDDET